MHPLGAIEAANEGTAAHPLPARGPCCGRLSMHSDSLPRLQQTAWSRLVKVVPMARASLPSLMLHSCAPCYPGFASTTSWLASRGNCKGQTLGTPSTCCLAEGRASLQPRPAKGMLDTHELVNQYRSVQNSCKCTGMYVLTCSRVHCCCSWTLAGAMHAQAHCMVMMFIKLTHTDCSHLQRCL